ncbi:hypothetical protein ABZP36_020368 [Zizania latifolia]
MASALPHVAVLLLLQLLLFPLLSSAQSAISLPPSSAPTASPGGVLHPDSTAADALAPSQPPSADEAALSPPAPPETSPFPAPSSEPPVPHSAAPAPSSMHSTASAPAPSAAKDEDDDSKDKDDDDEEHSSPAPAPAAEEIKAAAAAGDKTVDAESERHGDQLNGGKKAGVVVGAFTAAAVVGLVAFVWKKRQANIRRSRYADYSARLELV